MRFLDHSQRHTTVGRTPLYEWSADRRDLYLTTRNIHNKHPCRRRDSNPQSQHVSGRRPVQTLHELLFTNYPIQRMIIYGVCIMLDSATFIDRYRPTWSKYVKELNTLCYWSTQSVYIQNIIRQRVYGFHSICIDCNSKAVIWNRNIAHGFLGRSNYIRRNCR